MDRAWQATVHGVAKSQTQLSDFHKLCDVEKFAITVCASFFCLFVCFFVFYKMQLIIKLTPQGLL